MLALVALVGMTAWAGLTPVGRTGDQPQTTAAGAGKRGSFVHMVIFHLKKDAPANEVEALIADAHEMLGAIPSVRDLKVGRPAEKGTPDFAKKDFQVGLYVLFDDPAGLETYLKHPMHLKYVEKHIKQVDTEKLLVYDFIDQKK
jgi:hypothetical protein